MTELATIMAALIANIITSRVKPPKDRVFSEEDIAARRSVVRMVNLGLTLVGMITATWLLGDPLDLTSFGDTLTSLLEVLIAFGVAQGTYHLTKKED
jgi:hypothetical protein